MIKSIPLGSLVASERNVRCTSDPAADAQLAADIAAHGLLQNLVVSPTKPRGSYAVEAGGRRLRALQSLQADGVLCADHKVACLVLDVRGDDGAGASEVSLAENLQRLAMSPADECQSFGTLIEQGADVEGVARRFGLTVRHVEGRLRLAGLHPTVFAALGAEEITLDAAKAYAATSDIERQLWVFEQLGNGWNGAHADSIRRMMVSATVPASDRRIQFVGEEAYLAAGGRIERDLFAEADDARVLDVDVLDQLATDKLEVEAAWLANEHGYAFVRATLDTYIQSWRHDDLRHAAIELPGPSEQEHQEVEALESEMDRLGDLLEDEDASDTERAEAEARIEELDAQLRAIASKPPVLDAVTRGTVGFFLLLDDAGVPRLDRTPYALVCDGTDAASDGATATDGDGSSDTTGDARGVSTGSGGGSGTGAASDAPAKPKLSQRLVDELAMQRRDILQLHVARDPELAFDLAVFLMVKDEGSYCYDNAGFSLTARPPSDPVLRNQLPEAPAQALLVQSDNALDRSWTGQDTMAAKFDAFRALPRAAREAWLGVAIARTLEASAGAGGRLCAFHDHLGGLLGVDVAAHWRPTTHNWFDRVSKAQCLDALRDVGATELATRHAKSKKAEIAEACEKLFAGEAIVDAEVKAAALAWVPEPRRFAVSLPETPSLPWAEDEACGALARGPAAAIEGETEGLSSTPEDPSETKAAKGNAGTADCASGDVAPEVVSQDEVFIDGEPDIPIELGSEPHADLDQAA